MQASRSNEGEHMCEKAHDLTAPPRSGNDQYCTHADNLRAVRQALILYLRDRLQQPDQQTDAWRAIKLREIGAVELPATA